MASRSELAWARRKEEAHMGLEVHALGRAIEELRRSGKSFAASAYFCREEARRATALAKIAIEIEGLTGRAISLQRRLKAKRRTEQGTA
jgi:hypothetical protein